MPAILSHLPKDGGADLAKRKTNSSLAKQLRQAIRDSGLSLYELAKRSGVAAPTLSRFMRNERTLTLPVVSRICDTLGLHLCPKEGPEKRGPKPKRPE